MINQMYEELDIVVKRALGVTELIIDGMVYAEEKGMVETSYSLEANIKNVSIWFELYGSTMLLYANGNLLKKKMRMI